MASEGAGRASEGLESLWGRVGEKIEKIKVKEHVRWCYRLSSPMEPLPKSGCKIINGGEKNTKVLTFKRRKSRLLRFLSF